MAVLTFSRPAPVVRWFSFMMLLTAVWTITYSFELSSQMFEQMLLCLKVEYIGIAPLPGVWFVFVLLFIGKDHLLTKRNLVLIFFVPLITIFLVWTNQYHHFYYKSLYLDSHSAPFPIMALHGGVWYKVFMGYFYILLIYGSFLMIKKFKNADAIYRKQNQTLLFASLIPWVFNVLYLMGYRPYKYLDLTPYAFIATGIIVGFGLINFRLFNIVPVAREKIVELMTDGVLVLDREHRIVDFNHKMKDYFEKNHFSIIGTHFSELLKVGPDFIEFVNAEKPGCTELSLNLNNDTRLITVEGAPITDKAEKYSGIVLLFKDVTVQKQYALKLKQQSDELQELNSIKDKLFSIISHDLRTPLVNLMDVLRLIENKMLTKEEFEKMLHQLSGGIKYSHDLLENLLCWSRSQLKGSRVNLESFDVKLLINQELKYFIPRANDKGVTIHDAISENVFVYADPQMIRLVLRNLLSNAVKFCSAGNQVSIAVKEDNGKVLVSVKDNGVGMDRTAIEKLKRMESFTTRGTGDEAGSGLGLLLCKEFINQHASELLIESQLSEGSFFSFALSSK
ncbi:ATP-binding protein [Solitalea sp. MAHUQ-68]|uniref:histidine kinase n=2 Tax=Sphingobacteriaceae TaxID=84566 RepID=A0A9X2F5S6_9SPHI|nr:ATP-binding protein [Solitalea agri]